MNVIELRMRWKRADRLANKYREEYGQHHPITQEAVANAAILKNSYKEHLEKDRGLA